MPPLTRICLLTHINMQNTHLSDFDYNLPRHLIAQFPPKQRGESRLLYVAGNQFQDSLFQSLPHFLCKNDLLVFNDTKVIRARLFGQKSSGGRIEALIDRVLSTHTALAHLRTSHPPKPGSRLIFDGKWEAEMLGRQGEYFLLRFNGTHSVLEILDQSGHLPLPPYITHIPNQEDAERYQTFYACHPGAIAAPTAGLHFTKDLFTRLDQMGVKRAFLTLHVGAGTFQSIRTPHLSDHIMHHESYWIPQKTVEAIQATRALGGRIIAVGTTAMRALEAASQKGFLAETEGETNLFIKPGYRFQVVDRLITNFHLPKSSLLVLVSAFLGYEATMSAYRHAISQAYRFFSYGDAMLLERMDN